MVALPPPPPPPPVGYYDNAPTASIGGEIVVWTQADSVYRSTNGIYYIQSAEEIDTSTIEYRALLPPFDWLHCEWLPSWGTCWWPHDEKGSARGLTRRKARLRYPVGYI